MKYIISILFFLVVGQTNAALVTPAKVPSNLHIYSETGAVYVVMQSSGCSGTTYRLSPTHIRFDAILSILLAAQLADKPVVIRFNDCVNGSNPQGNIIGVYLK